MKLKIIFLSLIAFLFSSCSTDDGIDIIEFKATIREGSTLQLDCDYIIQPEAGDFVVPTFLPLDYREDGMKVYIKGEILNQASDCANLVGGGFLFRIEQISPN